MMFIRRLLAVWILLAGACGASAQNTHEVRGHVQELDASKGTITLTVLSQGKIVGVKTFRLLKTDIPVSNLAGQTLKLSDVQPEGLVTLNLNAAEDVVSVLAPLPNIRGSLIAVDPKGSTLILNLLPGPRTITAISPNTKIYLDGKPAALKDLTVGDAAGVTFTQDRKSVVEVRSGKWIGPQLPPMKRLGVLIDVDKDKRLARVFRTNPKGDISMLHELPLAKDATFSLSYDSVPIRALRIEEVTKGFSMTYWLDPVYKRVVHMDLEIPLLARRQVKAFDRKSGSLTILDDDVDRVLTLSPQVMVFGPSAASESSDEIVPGGIVDCGLHADRKQIDQFSSCPPSESSSEASSSMAY